MPSAAFFSISASDIVVFGSTARFGKPLSSSRKMRAAWLASCAWATSCSGGYTLMVPSTRAPGVPGAIEPYLRLTASRMLSWVLRHLASAEASSKPSDTSSFMSWSETLSRLLVACSAASGSLYFLFPPVHEPMPMSAISGSRATTSLRMVISSSLVRSAQLGSATASRRPRQARRSSAPQAGQRVAPTGRPGVCIVCTRSFMVVLQSCARLNRPPAGRAHAAAVREAAAAWRRPPRHPGSARAASSSARPAAAPRGW